MLLNQLIIVSVCRVEERRDGGRSEGIAVAGGFRPHAGASISTMATFPLPALRTRRAVFPQRALQWDHAARTRVDSSSVGMAQRLPPPAPREWHLSLFSPTAADPGGKPVLASPPSPAVPRFRAVPTVVPLRFRMRWFQRSRTQTGVLGQATPVVLRTFPHPSSPEAPSLHRNYPASLVLRASPPPPTAQADPHGFPVDACHATGGASRVATFSLLSTCHRQYPGGTDRCLRRSLPGRWQPSCVSQAGRLPHYPFRGLLSVRSRCSLRTR